LARQERRVFTRRLANIYLCNDGLPIDKSPLFQGYALMKSEFTNRDNRMRYAMRVAGYYYWKGNNNWHINWDWSAPDLANADGSPYKPYAIVPPDTADKNFNRKTGAG
jgi:hypothetical protein